MKASSGWGSLASVCIFRTVGYSHTDLWAHAILPSKGLVSNELLHTVVQRE